MTEVETLEQLLEEELLGAVVSTDKASGTVERIVVDLDTTTQGLVILTVNAHRCAIPFQTFKNYLKVHRHGYNDRAD